MRPSSHSSSRSSSPSSARSRHGGRHELGQNFLRHRPTIDRFRTLVGRTSGSILEIGPGDGALTRGLAALGRELTLVELDERRAEELRERYPRARVLCADALRVPFDAHVVVGNLPFHLTTPLLRKLLREHRWHHAVLLTQWEVARKRAGVGGGTMLTAQTSPWYRFGLKGRVPAHGFRPAPNVDGGVLEIARRRDPLVPDRERVAYQRFVRRVFTARGRGASRILTSEFALPRSARASVLGRAGVPSSALPRDLSPQQWAGLWRAISETGVGGRTVKVER